MPRQVGRGNVIATTAILPGNDENGYAFYGLPNGDYEVIATPESFNNDDSRASSPRRITINDSGASGIDLALSLLASIAGSVTLEKTGAVQKREVRRDSQLNEIAVRVRQDEPNERDNAFLSSFVRSPAGAVDGNGSFSIRGLKAGRYRLETLLPDEGWYIKAVKLRGAPTVSGDIGRSGVMLKSGERLTGVQVAVATGAAKLKGKVVVGAKPSGQIRVYLIPAEAEMREELLRYAEALTDIDGAFGFSNVVPGKYLLLTRSIPDTETNEKPMRPVAWDSTKLAKLRRDAETANILIELKPCQRVNDYVLHYGKL